MTDRSDRRRSTMTASPTNQTGDSGKENRWLKYSEIHEVCANGDADKLDELLKAGKNEFINYKDPDWDGRTPLHWCSIKGKGDMVRRLLEKGAHPGLRSDTGWTAAHFAAEIGKLNVLRVLHEMNSPMDRKDLYGDTPKQIAQIYGHKEVVEFLIKAEMEYRELRIRSELAGAAEPHDDEDKEWCDANGIKPQDYVTAEELKAIESKRRMSKEEIDASPKSSRKPVHYGKLKTSNSGANRMPKSPNPDRRKSKSNEASKSRNGDKKSPSTRRRRNGRRESSLEKIPER